MAFCTKNIAILLVDVSKSSVLLCIFVKIVENMNPNLLNFLEKDVLKNIVLLKMLHSYGDQIETHFQQVDGSSAVLLLLPTHAFYYDAHTYPQTKFVVLFSTDNLSANLGLLDAIPQDCNLVFKLMDADVKQSVASRFPLRRVTSFLSYTSLPDMDFALDPEVVVSEQADADCLPIFDAQGHPTATVQKQFANGEAINFVLKRAGQPISACFTYRNYEPVWEIGGVWSDPQARRSGFARRVVASALATLARQNRIPRYQVHEANLPSIHLAEALGLTRFVTLEHFLYESLTPSLR